MSWLKIAVSGSDVEFDRGYFSSALTASIFSGSHQGDGSGLTGIVSASFAISASWAPGSTLPPNLVSSSAQIIYSGVSGIPSGIYSSSLQESDPIFVNKSGSFATTGSNVFVSNQIISGSVNITGSLNVVGTVSGSFTGNGSGLTNILSSSYATTASYAHLAQSTRTICLTVDGGGIPITTGVKADVIIPFNCTITEWYIVADQIGSIVTDVWKSAFGAFPPTVANTITGTEKPTLVTSQTNSDTNLTTWTTIITSGDVLRFNVDSISTITRINLVIKAVT